MFTIGRLVIGRIVRSALRSKRPAEAHGANASLPSNHKTYWDVALIGCFMGLIALPGAGWLLGFSQPFDPKIELRESAPKFALKFKNAGPIPLPSLRVLKGVQSYFEDRYFLRSQATQAFLWSRIHGLTTVSEEFRVTKSQTHKSSEGSWSPNVVVGKDGWLFFTGNDSLIAYRRANPLDFAKLEIIRKHFEQHQQELKVRGIDYVLTFGPDKGTIYPEFLPSYIVQTHLPSRLDQVIEHFKKYSTVRIIDLRPALKESKQHIQLYHKTDTHWNQAGSQVACRALLEGLQHPNAAKETLEAYTVSRETRSGDERNMLGQMVPIEQAIVLSPRQPRKATVRFTENKAWMEAGMNESTCTDALPLRVYVAHDSFFSTSVGPVFFEHFKEVRCRVVWDIRELMLDEIDAFRPNLVLEELVERKLNSW